MSDPIEQHTLQGYSLGEAVGYVSRTVGYRATILEVLSHDHITDTSWIKLALPNGATVIVLDKNITKLPQDDTSSH